MYEAQQIKSALTMKQVAEFYGFRVNRQNLTVCPFHNDSKPSLHIYDGQRGWHCFACGTGGDIIDFVSKLFNLKFKDTIHKINDDFNLGLNLDTKPTHQAAYNRSLQIKQDIARKKRLAIIEQWTSQAEDVIAAYIRLMWQTQNKFKPIDGEFLDIFKYAITQLNYYEDLHQRIFIEGDFNTQLDFYQNNRKEVEAISDIVHTSREIGVIG